ncbi:MAG: copper resistance protein CopC [Acidimicrobiia bacterium]
MTHGLLFAVLAAAMIVTGSSAASASGGPATLIDASPGVDAVVVRPPEEVSLSFREPVSAVHVRLFKDDSLVFSADAVVEETLAIAVVGSAGPGNYLVDWKGTDTAGAAIAGAYVFLVDPRGSNSIAVDREVAGASGALGGLRVIAAAIAAVGTVALLAGVVQWLEHAPAETPKRSIGIAALATGIGSLAAGATYGVPADGSLADIISPGTVSSTIASGPGRAWVTATLLMGVMPFILVLGRSVRARRVAAGATGVTAVAGLWVAVGLGWLVRLPWPLLCIALAVATALWLSIETGRPVAVGVSLVVALAVAVPIVSGIRDSGTSTAVQTGDLLIEASLDPARSGINELHLYGFDISGGGLALGPTSVLAYHQAMDVGPLNLPVLRAGPNHFLSYRAMLPLSGSWTFHVTVATPEGGTEVASMEMNLQ